MTAHIAQLRKAVCVRQKELARQLGVSVRHLQAVEYGERESKSLCVRAQVILAAARK